MIPELPPGWTEVKVAELADVNYDKGLRKKDRVESGPVGVYGSAGLVGYHNVSLRENVGAGWLRVPD
ncbi:MAG: hypothetical protein OXH61_02910 [Acidimicrobiaceae bacterium]|nr:hypothetical protein [Acidimicrobiaceae bacterium]